jgi:hypothetical protein
VELLEACVYVRECGLVDVLGGGGYRSEGRGLGFKRK